MGSLRLLLQDLIGYTPEPERSYAGYQVAGGRFDQYTSQDKTGFLRNVLTGWFGYSNSTANEILRAMTNCGNLEDQVVDDDGVELVSPDGKEIYHFKRLRPACWEVTRLAPEIPIMKVYKK